MLDREVVRDFLLEVFEEQDIEIPKDIPIDALVEALCEYVENDFYEWLKDNFKSFFNHGNSDWNWIREKIRKT